MELKRNYNFAIDLKTLTVEHNSKAVFYDKDKNTAFLNVQMNLDNKPIVLTNIKALAKIRNEFGEVFEQDALISDPNNGIIAINFETKNLSIGVNDLQIILTDDADNKILNVPVITYEVYQAIEGEIREFREEKSIIVKHIKDTLEEKQKIQDEIVDLYRQFNRLYTIDIDLKSLSVEHNSDAMFFNSDKNTSSLLVSLFADGKSFNLKDCISYAFIEDDSGMIYEQNSRIVNDEDAKVLVEFKQSGLLVGENKLQIILVDSNGNLMYVPIITYQVFETISNVDISSVENGQNLLEVVGVVQLNASKIKKVESEITLLVEQMKKLDNENTNNKNNEDIKKIKTDFKELSDSLNKSLFLFEEKQSTTTSSLKKIETELKDCKNKIKELKEEQENIQSPPIISGDGQVIDLNWKSIKGKPDVVTKEYLTEELNNLKVKIPEQKIETIQTDYILNLFK